MKTLIIAVAYLEPSWKATQDCLLRCDNRVIIVDREGVGSLAGAYNHAFNKYSKGYEYVWFVSNVTFKPGLVNELEQAMEAWPDYAAIHPIMMTSDHPHMRSSLYLKSKLDKCVLVRPVPFVEFTAPMVRVDVFEKMQLDESMPYMGHDLDWGYRIREAGYKIGVHHGVSVEHSYIRHSPDHPITRARHSNRKAMDQLTKARLVEKYGPQWESKLKYFNKLES